MWAFETLGKFRQERIKGEIIVFDDLIKEIEFYDGPEICPKVCRIENLKIRYK